MKEPRSLKDIKASLEQDLLDLKFENPAYSFIPGEVRQEYLTKRIRWVDDSLNMIALLEERQKGEPKELTWAEVKKRFKQSDEYQFNPPQNHFGIFLKWADRMNIKLSQ